MDGYTPRLQISSIIYYHKPNINNDINTNQFDDDKNI